MSFLAVYYYYYNSIFFKKAIGCRRASEVSMTYTHQDISVKVDS